MAATESDDQDRLQRELAQSRGALIEKEAELDRVRRESLRADAERARAESLRAQLEARDLELLQVRERTQKALEQAESELSQAAKKIEEATIPRPVSTGTELNDARVRAARLSAELTELRGEREELRQKLESVKGEVDGARSSAAALRAAISARDERAGTAEASQKGTLERLRLVEAEVLASRAEQDRLAKAEDEARAAAAGALRERAGVVASLEMAQRELLAAKEEGRDRETRLIAEAHSREQQITSAAQAREAQLAATIVQLQQDLKDANGQITALTGASVEARAGLEQVRGREAALDAELRLARGQQHEAQEELEQQLAAARTDVRKLQADIEGLKDTAGRADARTAELQAVVDSLGRERAALRSEAGAMRARVEVLSIADERARKLTQELDDLRGEYDFLNQELARSNSNPRVPVPSKLTGA